MLSAITRFVREKLAPDAAPTAEDAAHRTRLAAAALLVEVLRSDHQVSPEERRALLEALIRKFGLDEAETTQLIELAEAEAREAVDLYQFTSQINASFTHEQKRRLVEELWRMAYADGVLHHYEEHLIRRIADLIHVSHSEFIAAKLRVTG